MLQDCQNWVVRKKHTDNATGLSKQSGEEETHNATGLSKQSGEEETHNATELSKQSGEEKTHRQCYRTVKTEW